MLLQCDVKVMKTFLNAHSAMASSLFKVSQRPLFAETHLSYFMEWEYEMKRRAALKTNEGTYSSPSRSLPNFVDKIIRAHVMLLFDTKYFKSSSANYVRLAIVHARHSLHRRTRATDLLVCKTIILHKFLKLIGVHVAASNSTA